MEGLGKGKGPGSASDAQDDGVTLLRLPLVSLRHFSQDELVQLSRAQGCRLADTYFSHIVVPSLDRNAFNESVGSKKQTYRNWEDYWPKQAQSEEDGGRAGDVKQQQQQQQQDREEEDEQAGKRKHRRKKTSQQRLINRPVYSDKRKKRASPVAEVTPLKTWTSPRRAPGCSDAGNSTVFVDTAMGGLHLSGAAAAHQGNHQQQLCKPRRASRLGRTVDGTTSVVDEKKQPVDDGDEGASVPVTIIPSGRSQVPFEIRAVREDLAEEEEEDAKPPSVSRSLPGFAVPAEVRPVAANSVSQATFEEEGGQSGAAVPPDCGDNIITSRPPSSALPCQTGNIRGSPPAPAAESAQVTSDESTALCHHSALVQAEKVTIGRMDGRSRRFLPHSPHSEGTALPTFENRVVREDPGLESIRRSEDLPLPCQGRQFPARVGSHQAPVPFDSGAVWDDLVAQEAAQRTAEDVRRSQGFPFPFGTGAAHVHAVPRQGFPVPPFENRAVREAPVAGDAAQPRLEVADRCQGLPLPFEYRARSEDCVAQLAMGTAAPQLLSTEVATTTVELGPAAGGGRSRRTMGTDGITEWVDSASNFQHLHAEPMQIDDIAPAEVDSESGNVEEMTNHVTPVQFTRAHSNGMRDAALTQVPPDVSTSLFDDAPEATISYLQLALEASNPEGELAPEVTMSPGKIAPMASAVIASEAAPLFLDIAAAAAMSPVEIATEDGDMRWHLKDSEVSAAPIVSASELDYAPMQCVQCVQCEQCEADVASMQSYSETDAEDSMLRQAEVNAAAIASGLCTIGWMKDVVLEASTDTSAEMGCMTSGLYQLDMNAASADTSFDSSDTNLELVDNEMMRTEKSSTLGADDPMETVPAYKTDSDCTQLLKRHGDSASGDGNLEAGEEDAVYRANIPMIGESFFVGNTSQSTGMEHEQVASGDDGGILMLERFIQMVSQGHSKEFSKPKLESRGGKRKLTQTEYLSVEETHSKRFKSEIPQASYLNSEERGVVHGLQGEQHSGGSDKPQPLEVCTEDANGVRENNESIGESSEQERNSSVPVLPGAWQPRATWVATKEVHAGGPEQLQQPSSGFVGVSQNPPPLLPWGFPMPQQAPAVTSVVSAVDQSCESGVTHEVVHTDLPEQETCKEVNELKPVISVPNVQTQCTEDPPTSPGQPKLKAEMERRLAAIEGKWLTDRRKVVVADNFPEGWTVCVFLRTKGGRATLEYRSWKSPEGKVFGTFKDAAEYVQSTTGVVVKNRGVLKTEQAREKKNLQPGGVAASQEAAPPSLLHDCRICGSKFTSEAALMQHRVVHDLSYTELRELSHLQKLETQKATPAVAQVPRVVEGPIAEEEKEKAAGTPCLPSRRNVPTQDKVAITCSICSGTFSCKKNLRRHTQRRHPDNQCKGLTNADNAVSRPDLQNVQPPPHCVS